VNHEIIANIAACDPRYQGHTPDGKIVLLEDDERHVLTPHEFMELADPSTDEIFFATITAFLADISATSITSTSSVVDVLLDLRGLFIKREEQHKSLIKFLMHGMTSDGSDEEDS